MPDEATVVALIYVLGTLALFSLVAGRLPLPRANERKDKDQDEGNQT